MKEVSWSNVINTVITDEWVIKHTTFLDEWKPTSFSFYPSIKMKSKGELGEQLVAEYMRARGHHVIGRKGSGHDLIVDGYRTEIKFSVRLFDKTMFNHIAEGKDWERLIFLLINAKTEEVFVRWMSKEDFQQNIEVFSHQQGGKNGNNDDFILSESRNFLKLPFVKKMEQW